MIAVLDRTGGHRVQTWIANPIAMTLKTELRELQKYVQKNTDPVFLLVHTTDAELRPGPDVVTRVNDFETSLGITPPRAVAIVYFSGAPNGAAHIPSTGLSAGIRRHVVDTAVTVLTVHEFAKRILRVEADWNERVAATQDAVPTWDLLRYDWIDEAVECLFAIGLGCAFIESSPLAADTVRTQGAQLGITADEMATLGGVSDSWRRPLAVHPDALRSALAFLVALDTSNDAG